MGEKLGVPFVRVCPADLPNVITTPLWIAAAPIGCTSGEHETVPCPPVLALLAGHDVIEPRTAQLIEAAFAHRTCALRFGGRLPTTRERAQAQAALGLDTILVAEPADRSRRLRRLPEWTTATPCTDPSTITRDCRPSTYPASATSDLAWSELRSCRASARPAAGALVVEPGDRCPPTGPSLPPCLLRSPATGPAPDRAFALACRELDAAEAVHPDESSARLAAFRCVVPEGTLAGTIR